VACFCSRFFLVGVTGKRRRLSLQQCLNLQILFLVVDEKKKKHNFLEKLLFFFFQTSPNQPLRNISNERRRNFPAATFFFSLTVNS
jgi:hypothetical protein